MEEAEITLRKLNRKIGLILGVSILFWAAFAVVLGERSPMGVFKTVLGGLLLEGGVVAILFSIPLVIGFAIILLALPFIIYDWLRDRKEDKEDE